MKKKLFSISLVVAGLIGLSFNHHHAKSSIIGKVNPVDAAEVVWAISDTDSVKTGITMGQFYFDVKPGSYKLIIDAKEPYKDVLMENLQVKPDETLDVGEITLK